ncbi:MAG: hypothetical protein KAS32_09055 [Candidatus Peribacteraceae bacterium]|nr:hypothetical protein [Candidatus Peribacteraceae bacterium]
MASSRPQIIKTFIAGQDFSSLRYHAVKLSTEKTIAVCGANEKAMGFIQNAPTSGQRAEVAVAGGGALAKINETVAVGKYLTSTASGKMEVADAAGEHVIAMAADPGVQNDVIAVDVGFFTAHASDA